MEVERGRSVGLGEAPLWKMAGAWLLGMQKSAARRRRQASGYSLRVMRPRVRS